MTSGIDSAVRRALILAAKTAAIAGVTDASGCEQHQFASETGEASVSTGGSNGAGGARSSGGQPIADAAVHDASKDGR